MNTRAGERETAATARQLRRCESAGAPAAGALFLALQRAVGNVAVARLLERRSPSPMCAIARQANVGTPASRDTSDQAALAGLIGNGTSGRLLERQIRPSLINSVELLSRLDLHTLLEVATSDADYWLGSAIFTREWVARERELVEENIRLKLRNVVRFEYRSALDAEDAVLAIRDLRPLEPRLLLLMAQHVVRHPDQWRRALGRLSGNRGWRRRFPKLYVHLTVQLEKFVVRDIALGPTWGMPSETYPVWDLHDDGHPNVATVDVTPHPREAEQLDTRPVFPSGSRTVMQFTFPIKVPLSGRRTPPVPRPIPTPTPRRITIPAEMLFRFDRSDIRREAADNLLAYLGSRPSRADPSRQVEVRGHADAIGWPEYNQDLSKRRADAVKEFLERHYPNLRGHIHAQGFGETQPVAPNEVGGRDNPAGRAKNRRVEIEFTILEAQ